MTLLNDLEDQNKLLASIQRASSFPARMVQKFSVDGAIVLFLYDERKLERGFPTMVLSLFQVDLCQVCHTVVGFVSLHWAI
jgi:hypothetical protein